MILNVVVPDYHYTCNPITMIHSLKPYIVAATQHCSSTTNVLLINYSLPAPKTATAAK